MLIKEVFLRMGKVTAIASGKGGTGKTFVTAGLGIALAKRNRRVLLIDFNPYLRGIDLMLGTDNGLLFDMGDIFSGNCSPNRAIYQCEGIGGLFIMSASQNTNDNISPELMKSLMDVLKDEYDYILIDCHGCGRIFEAAVRSSGQTVILTNAESLAVRCAEKISRKLKEMGLNNNHLVINNFNERKFFRLDCFQDIDEIIDKIGVRLLGMIPEDEEFAFALQKSSPFAVRTKAAYAFDRIAARLDGVDVSLFIE